MAETAVKLMIKELLCFCGFIGLTMILSLMATTGILTTTTGFVEWS